MFDGGPGSDVLLGYGGDDRLFGDTGDGQASDVDRLFAGAGADDLIGGQGTNELYAWTFHPQAGATASRSTAADPATQFGVFVNPDDGSLHFNDNDGAYVAEDTGLNRILGGPGNDQLFGGTGLDFMYGAEGTNTLYRADGSTFESLDGGLAGDEWKDQWQDSEQRQFSSASSCRQILCSSAGGIGCRTPSSRRRDDSS